MDHIMSDLYILVEILHRYPFRAEIQCPGRRLCAITANQRTYSAACLSIWTILSSGWSGVI